MAGDASAGPTPAPRRLVATALADPDIYKDKTRFILTGTHDLDTSVIPILITSNLHAPPDRARFTLKTYYEPNRPGATAYDPAWQYCHLWAPELARVGGRLRLYFSAMRIPRHMPPVNRPAPPADDTVTLFYADCVGDLVFGPPHPVEPYRPGWPGHTLGCVPGHASGSPEQVKIDPTIVNALTPPRMLYVWFSAGNHIASINMTGDAPEIIRHADPAQPEDEAVCEAPDWMQRHGRQYLFYSTGAFNSRYRLVYLMADKFEDLVAGKVPRRTLCELGRQKTVDGHEGPLLENHGHSSVVEYDGEYYLFFHVGHFNNGQWRPGRDTYVCRLIFNEDGTIVPLNIPS